MFSMFRRFAPYADDIRATFTHFSEVNLIVLRRVLLALIDMGIERLSPDRLHFIRNEVWQESSANAERVASTLDALPCLQYPKRLDETTDEEILSCDGVFIASTDQWSTWPATPAWAACCSRCTTPARPSPHCATVRFRPHKRLCRILLSLAISRIAARL